LRDKTEFIERLYLFMIEPMAASGAVHMAIIELHHITLQLLALSCGENGILFHRGGSAEL